MWFGPPFAVAAGSAVLVIDGLAADAALGQRLQRLRDLVETGPVPTTTGRTVPWPTRAVIGETVRRRPV